MIRNLHRKVLDMFVQTILDFLVTAVQVQMSQDAINVFLDKMNENMHEVDVTLASQAWEIANVLVQYEVVQVERTLHLFLEDRRG